MISEFVVGIEIRPPLAGTAVKKIDMTAPTVMSHQTHIGIRARKADAKNAVTHPDSYVLQSEIAGKLGTFYDEPDRFTCLTAIFDKEQRDAAVSGGCSLHEHSLDEDPGHGSPEAEAVKHRNYSDADDDVHSSGIYFGWKASVL